MTNLTLKLDSIERIKKFNSTVTKFHCDFDLEQGRYFIDAKSMMGLLSLDLNSPIELHFQASEDEEKSILSSLTDFILE
ncbi:MAG: HPr family phosphocarrier protein [Lachnospiraceae bacterium]|nr:HPr family phosphocarrier protein [Lachnospiraceae bacterium]